MAAIRGIEHEFRNYTDGLYILGTVSERSSREESRVIIDEFASEAIRLVVPGTLWYELQGWARSWYELDQHIKAIESYAGPKLPEPTDTAWNETKQYVLTEFRRFERVTPISYKDFDSVKWISSSAAGYGYIGKKGDNDNYRKAKRTAVTIAEKLDHDRNYGKVAIKESTPDVAFTRTQLSHVKVKTKVRNVWGEAFHYVLLEGLFADPLIAKFKEINSFYFIGKDPLLSVPLLIEEIVASRDYVYMFDWSQFDASVQEWEIRFAFSCLEQMLSFPSNVEAQIWRFVIELFIYRKISGPNGKLYLKCQGIPSGSCFTNIIGSIVNYLRIQYVFKRLTNRFAIVYTHGDDSLAAVDTTQHVRIDTIADLCSQYNWTLNAKKTTVSLQSEGISFLSRTVRAGQNYREELTCLRMLMYPEYEVQSGDISALRAISIFKDSGLHSQFLYKILDYLRTRYGCAKELPTRFRVWDPAEYETRKVSGSSFM